MRWDKKAKLFYLTKLIKYDIIKSTYINLLKLYTTNNNKNNNKYYIDTTLIVNKLGIDNIGYNIQLLKHKTSKLSIITDIYGIPFS